MYLRFVFPNLFLLLFVPLLFLLVEIYYTPFESNPVCTIFLSNIHLCFSHCGLDSQFNIPYYYRVCNLCNLERFLYVSQGIPFSYSQSSNTSYPVYNFGTAVPFFSHPYIPNNITLLVVILSRSHEYERRLYHRECISSFTNHTIRVYLLYPIINQEMSYSTNKWNMEICYLLIILKITIFCLCQFFIQSSILIIIRHLKVIYSKQIQIAISIMEICYR